MARKTTGKPSRTRKDTPLPPQGLRRLRTIKLQREAREVEAAKWNGPHCLDCGSERISFVYMERVNGTVINERGALSMACNIIGAEIDAATEDPSWLAEMAYTQHELASMWTRRPGPSEKGQQ